MATGWQPRLRTLLVLGRVSNLPTVWSNCLAAWLLGGGGSAKDFTFILLGASLVYLGGMFLNDAFDVEFDRQRRPERPIPSGLIAASEAWRWGLALMGVGLVCLAVPGNDSLFVALLLSATILVYDAAHKIVAFSPVLVALCRFLLVLLAATPTAGGPTGLVIWSALVLGCYVAGLGFLARLETRPAVVKFWPALLLIAPLLLSSVVNRGPWIFRGVLMSAVLGCWMLLCLRHAYWTAQRNVGRCVGGLLAGIVLVDWLAVGTGGLGTNIAFAGLFALTLLLQRFVPAT
jgi:4-hydroxybenzoate polyprenyltransferase